MPAVYGTVTTTRAATDPALADSCPAAAGAGSAGPAVAARLRKRRLTIRDRRSAHFDSRVAPRVDVPCGIADPILADAQPGHERHRPVDDDHLAMIAADPAERHVQARRVVTAHLDATGTQS